MRFFAFVLAMLMAAPLAAKTVTFDSTTQGEIVFETGSAVIKELGPWVWEDSLINYDEFIDLHDDFGGTNWGALSGNTPFALKSVKFGIYSQYYWDEYETPDYMLARFTIQKKDGTIVSQEFMRSQAGWFDLTFGDEYSEVEAIAWSYYLPPEPYEIALIPEYGPILGQFWCEEWCGGVAISKVVVDVPAEVPLPATAWLLGAAVAGLVMRRQVRPSRARLASNSAARAYRPSFRSPPLARQVDLSLATRGQI